VPAGLRSVTQVRAGDTQTCAVKSDGTVTCWGENGASASAGLSGGTQVSTNISRSCVLKSDITLFAGPNPSGQPPTPAPLAGSFTQVSVGYDDICGLRSDGGISCAVSGGVPHTRAGLR
jgi:Regulator of chromosome condensation (RCC1) repeat